MIVVIIAGGSGTRLWPLSTPDFPKHLLKMSGDPKSLLQNTYDRATRLSDQVYVVPEIGHLKYVKKQLPDLKNDAFIVEPGRRGTANCFVAALHHLKGRENPDEPIAFIHADHYIRDLKGFIHSFLIAENTAKRHDRVVLIGVEPDHPSTGFGYIHKANVFNDQDFIFNVGSFKEKPAHDLAQKYVKSGDYLWNCGYFVGSLNTFLGKMKAHAPKLYVNYERLAKTKSVEDLSKTYLSFKNDTIDYALMENMDDLLVVPASFDWMDLGSYSDVHKAVASDELGNHVTGLQIHLDGVENSFIHSDEDKPIAVIGLDNVVVVNTPRGMLVARKDLAQKVGDIAKQL